MRSISDPQGSPENFTRLVAALVYVTLVAGQFQIPNVLGASGRGLPVAFVALLTVLAAFAGPTVMCLRRQRQAALSPSFYAVLGLFAVILLSGLWSDGGPASWDQSMWILVLLAVLALLSALLQLAPIAVIDVFMLMGAITGIVFAVAGLIGEGGSARLAAFGGGPNVFARITGVGIVSCVFWMMRGGRGWQILIMFVPLLAIATVMSGSRGGMVATLAGILVVTIAFSARTWRRCAIWALLILPIVLFLYSVFGRTLQAVIEQRVVKLTFEEGYTAGRGGLWSIASDMIGDSPLIGSGIGTFIDRNQLYAHNLFLQVAVDAGLFGVVSLLVVLGYFVGKIGLSTLRNPLVNGPVAAASVIFASSMFSGDYYDTRLLWAYLMLAVAAAPLVRAGRLEPSGRADPIQIGRAH